MADESSQSAAGTIRRQDEHSKKRAELSETFQRVVDWKITPRL